LFHRSHQVRAIRARVRHHTRKRRRIQKDDGKAVSSATTSTESPPGPEKERAPNRTQLLIFASMQSAAKKSVIIFWLDAKISSYSLYRERELGVEDSPLRVARKQAIPLSPSRLFAKANKKRVGGVNPFSLRAGALASHERETAPF
jgi:hypothetical protein